MSAEARIDMALIDEKVLAYIKASDNKALTFLEIARGVKCAPITVRRSVHRLKAAGQLQWDGSAGRIFRFTVNGEEQTN